MLWPKFKATWSGALSENRFNRVVIVCLIGVMGIWAIRDAMVGTIVTITPPVFEKPITIGRSSASESLFEGFSWSVAQQLGNVTPANVDSIKQFIEPLLAPEVYQPVLDAIDKEAQDIKQDRVTYRFDARKMAFEEETGKYFISGNRYVSGPAAPERAAEAITYEFMWVQRAYRPWITSFTFYEGAARTIDELKREKDLEGRQHHREASGSQTPEEHH